MKLTLPQQDVYFEQLLYPKEPIYNIGAKIEIRGELDSELLAIAYSKLIDQHDAYRIQLKKNVDNAVSMEVKVAHDTNLGFLDFSDKKDALKDANVYMQTEFGKPFDLFGDALLHKFVLIKVMNGFHYLFSVYHHIITDGWGTSLMFKRLVNNYNELVAFGEVRTTYPYSYTTFVEDDLKYQNSIDLLDDRAYWIERFKELPENVFPIKDQITLVNKSSRKELIVKREVYNQLNSLAVEYKSSTFHILLGLLYVYFGRKHQKNDMSIGLPVLNRGKSIFKKTVGLFMGVSPLRISMDWETTFPDIITDIKNQLRKDYRHQRFPIGKLIQELQIFKDKNRLFNITLSYEKQDYSHQFGQTKTRVIPLSHQSERVALAIYIREFDVGEDIKIDFDYNLSFFDDSEISQVVRHIEHLIDEVLDKPREKVKELNYMSPIEREQLLQEYNTTEVIYEQHKTLLDFFKEQVDKLPDKVAVNDGRRSCSYLELDRFSNQIASYFDSRCKEDKEAIGVLLGRSVDMVALLLGILKSGRAFIPIDPNFPKERISYIIQNSQISLLIQDKRYCDKQHFEKQLEILDLKNVIRGAQNMKDSISILVSPQDTAYVIYTSGSTGNPKGVEIGHFSLLNFLLSMQKRPGISKKDVLFSVTTYSFDISLLEFFIPLISGAQLYLVSQEVLEEPYSILENLTQVAPTILQATPSFYQMLFNVGWKGQSSLKVLCGGDLLSRSLAQKLLDGCQEVWNMYGPTETTIWSSIKKVGRREDASIIGKPIDNTKFYILDDFLNPLPIGTIGTIYIGGSGLAKGYFKNVELTNEKFISNPFSAKGKIYNTGDLGKWNKNGEVLFLGRNDNQVKIRGYRIELDAIETKLNEIDIVKSSVVIAHKTENQEAVLVAYIIPESFPVKQSEIINAMRDQLPEYMIPYSIVPLEKFPLTTNQKVNRKALSEQKIFKKNTDTVQKPSTDLEYTLYKFYKEVLGIAEEISITDNFFSLGGHSLNAVRLIGLVEKELRFRISLKTIFNFPTIVALATHLENEDIQEAQQIERQPLKPHYPITFPQYAIWLASLQKERSIAYNMSASYKVIGDLDVTILEKAFESAVHKYEPLRTSFMEFEGIPRQKINAKEEVLFKIDTFVYKEKEAFDKALITYANQELSLKDKVLLKVGIFENSNGDTVMSVVTHHISMDGWSIEVLTAYIVSYYNAKISQVRFEEKALSLQFKDYVVWQNDRVEEQQKNHEEFWEEYLKDYEWKPLFPYDANGEEEGNKGALYTYEWDADFFNTLNQVALKFEVTLHTLLITAFNVLIYKVQDLDDICIGTINSGRAGSEQMYDQIGMFVKTLPLRLKMEPKQKLSELLTYTHQSLLEVDKYQDIPQDIFSRIRVEAIFVLQNPTFNYNKIKVNESLTLDLIPVDTTFNRLPLIVNISINEGKMIGSVYYDTNKYTREAITLILLRFKKVLDHIVINSDILIEEINTDLAFEQQKPIEFEFNF